MSSPELEMRSCTGHGVNWSTGKVGSGHLGSKLTSCNSGMHYTDVDAADGDNDENDYHVQRRFIEKRYKKVIVLPLMGKATRFPFLQTEQRTTKNCCNVHDKRR